MLIKIQ